MNRSRSSGGRSRAACLAALRTPIATAAALSPAQSISSRFTTGNHRRRTSQLANFDAAFLNRRGAALRVSMAATPPRWLSVRSAARNTTGSRHQSARSVFVVNASLPSLRQKRVRVIYNQPRRGHWVESRSRCRLHNQPSLVRALRQ